MNRKQYEAKRAFLMNEAQKLLDEGDVEKANAKMDEVKDLDAQWDAIAQAEANLRALNKEPVPALRMDEGQLPGKEDTGTGDQAEDAWKSDTYKYAWAKMLMDKPLNAKEREVYDRVNNAFNGVMTNESFTHTTKNTSVVIPESVSKGIWVMVGEMYPYFEDITKTYVNGILSMIKEKSSSDAGWYEEDTPTEDGKEEFAKFTLGGCELSRSITVSWKLKEMAIEDFIPYIQRKMARKMGAAVGYGVTHGKGNADPSKPEPTGVITALEAENETPRVLEYAGIPTYQDFTKARAKLKSGYRNGLAIYANNNTIWTKIAMVLDQQGRPLFVPDPTSGGVYRVLGLLVKEDGSMKDGEILFSNPREGYQANINKELSMMQEDHVKARTTDYAGYAIMDGNVLTEEAHVLLKEKASAMSLKGNADDPVTKAPNAGTTANPAAGTDADTDADATVANTGKAK